jgi:hypothetical protein
MSERLFTLYISHTANRSLLIQAGEVERGAVLAAGCARNTDDGLLHSLLKTPVTQKSNTLCSATSRCSLQCPQLPPARPSCGGRSPGGLALTPSADTSNSPWLLREIWLSLQQPLVWSTTWRCTRTGKLTMVRPAVLLHNTIFTSQLSLYLFAAKPASAVRLRPSNHRRLPDPHPTQHWFSCLYACPPHRTLTRPTTPAQVRARTKTTRIFGWRGCLSWTTWR